MQPATSADHIAQIAPLTDVELLFHRLPLPMGERGGPLHARSCGEGGMGLRSRQSRLRSTFSGYSPCCLPVGAGAYLRDIAQELVGVDLSPRMLHFARQLEVYDELQVLG